MADLVIQVAYLDIPTTILLSSSCVCLSLQCKRPEIATNVSAEKRLQMAGREFAKESAGRPFECWGLRVVSFDQTHAAGCLTGQASLFAKHPWWPATTQTWWKTAFASALCSHTGVADSFVPWPLFGKNVGSSFTF